MAEVIKLRGGYQSGPCSNLTGVLIKKKGKLWFQTQSATQGQWLVTTIRELPEARTEAWKATLSQNLQRDHGPTTP